jgi:hypothetical protein
VAVAGLIDYFKANGFIESDGHLELPEDAALEPLMVANAALEAKISSFEESQHRNTESISTANLSLKQKALLQQEQMKIDARKKAKKQRDEELAKIEQDKMVRKTDENWSAQAAGVKGGKPIETFRGKFGEEQGGG